MSDAGERRTEEGFRRLIAFTDAVVAIALTLLVLPLVEITTEERDATSVLDVVDDHWYEIISFLISFAVIWVLWHHHHGLIEHFRAYDRTLINLHFVWLFTIVVLPFATAMLDDSNVEWSNVFYIAVLAISIGSLSAMTWWGMRHRELLEDDDVTGDWVAEGLDLGSLIMVVVALVVAAIFRDSGAWPLLLLLASGPVGLLLRRRT